MRLIPIILVVAVLMLSLRVGDIWLTLKGGPSEETARQPGIALAQDGGGGGGEAAGDAASRDGGNDAASPPSEGAVPQGMKPLEMTNEAAPEIETDGELLPGEMRLIHDLAKRREQLESRERKLDEREALLSAAEQRLVTKQRQLEQLRQDIEDLVARYDKSQEEETSVLRQTYQNMKPKSAAAIFNDLELSTLLDVVRGMPARILAPILAAMNTEKARIVTQELALREELPTLPQ